MLQLENPKTIGKNEWWIRAQKSITKKILLFLENSKSLYENTICKQRTASNTRKSYEIEQMSIEDYLKYEDDVVLKKQTL